MRSPVWVGGDIRIFALPDGHYSMEFLELSFKPEFDADGKVIALLGVDPSGNPVRAERVELPSLSPEDCKPYLGLYHCRDLLTTYEVLMRGQDLYMYQPHHPHLKLEPIGKDQFRSQVYGFNTIEFIRDGHAKVTAFSVSSNRSWNVKFERV